MTTQPTIRPPVVQQPGVTVWTYQPATTATISGPAK